MHIRMLPFARAFALAALLAALPRPAQAIHAAGTLPGVTVSNDTLALSLQGGIGMAQGQAREVVYSADELGGEYKLSELFWDIEEVVMAGGSLSVQIGPRNRVSAGYWTAVTEGSGQMDDFDWLYGPETPWSDWSLSDVDVRDTYAFDLNLAAELFRQNNLTFSGVVGYRQDQWSWDDHGLGYIYSENGFRDSVGLSDGSTGITYEQLFSIPYLGVIIGLNGPRLSAEVYFHYSPLVEAEDHDYHVFRDTKFDTEASGGDYYGTGIRVGYRFNPQWSSTVSADWQIIPEMRADTTIIAPDGTETIPNSAGIANEWMMLSFSVGYDF